MGETHHLIEEIYRRGRIGSDLYSDTELHAARGEKKEKSLEASNRC